MNIGQYLAKPQPVVKFKRDELHALYTFIYIEIGNCKEAQVRGENPDGLFAVLMPIAVLESLADRMDDKWLKASKPIIKFKFKHTEAWAFMVMFRFSKTQNHFNKMILNYTISELQQKYA